MKEKLGEILRSKLYNDGVKIISHLLNTLITHKYIYNKLKCKSYLTEKTQSCQKSIINMKLCTLFSPDRHQRQRSVGSCLYWDRWWQCYSVPQWSRWLWWGSETPAEPPESNKCDNRALIITTTGPLKLSSVFCETSRKLTIPCDHFRTIHCLIKPPTTEAGIWRERH